jgi:Icc-related predicted phosphoesterase
MLTGVLGVNMKILVVGDFQGKFSNKLMNNIKKEDFDIIICVGDISGLDEWRHWAMARMNAMKKGKPIPEAVEYFGKKKYRELLKKEYKSAKEVYQKLDSFGKPVFYIFGNTDDGWYNYPFEAKGSKVKKRNANIIKNLKNFISLNYKTKEYNSIEMLGFGGYMDIEAFLKPEFFKERGEEYKRRVKKRLDKSRIKLFNIANKMKGNKLFIFHYPPKGIFDIIKSKNNPMNGESAGVLAFTDSIKKFRPKLVLCGHMHEYQGKKKLGKSIVINPGDTGEGKYAIVDWPSLKTKFVK